MNLYSYIHDFVPMMYLFYELKNNFIFFISSLLHYDNEMPMIQVPTCENCDRKIDRARSFRSHKTWHTYVCAITHNGNTLFVIFLTTIWVTSKRNFVVVTLLYARSRFKSVRPSNELFYWHTLSVPFCVRQKKKNAKERERGGINKGKYNREAWFTLSRMRTPGVPFSLTSPIYLGSFFFLLLFSSKYNRSFIEFSTVSMNFTFSNVSNKVVISYWYNSLPISKASNEWNFINIILKTRWN